jgi:hypothetical protein
MKDLEALLKALSDIKAKAASLAERETACKACILEIMRKEGLDKESGPYGSIRIQRRSEKDYGKEVKAMEKELKEAKKLKDDLGDFSIVKTTESLVFTPAPIEELF